MLVPGLAIGLVYALGVVGAIAPAPWIGATLLVAVLTVALTGPGAWAVLWSDALAVRDGAQEVRRDPVALCALGIASIAIGLAALSTYLLAPWAWDSLGYHLPIVHDALQTGTLRHVPTTVVYVNVYPRLVDVFFVAWRLSLGSETWIEIGQLPFAIGGVLAIAALAERAGVPPPRAVALSTLWLAIPVVMLELAAAYVDVAVGALALLSFVLATGRGGSGLRVVAGVAIGLLLGSKASAPPIAAVAMLAMLAVAARSERLGSAVASCALALAIGAGKYVENVLEWHNPIWPAHVSVAGHTILPGKATTAEIASSGLREPYLSMGWLERLAASWLAWPDTWVFDMRIGGFGPLFTLLLLPLGLAFPLVAWRSPRMRALARAIGVPVLLTVGATLLSPGAFWARYTVAIPGALLALAISVASALRARAARLAHGALLALALLGVVLSWRGFTEPSSPSLFELVALPRAERERAQAVDAEEHEWQRARALVGPGEAFGYDPSFTLPGRLWIAPDRRVVYLPETTPSAEELLAWAARERVRVVVLGVGPTGSADAARARPDRFRELFASSYPWMPCAVFEILEPR